DVATAVAGEDVVVGQRDAGRDAADLTLDGGGQARTAEIGDAAADRAGDVGAVAVDDVLAAAGDARGVNLVLDLRLALEEGVVVADAGVDDADLDAGTSVSLPAQLTPYLGGVDDVDTGVHRRLVGPALLDRGDLGVP